MDANSPFVKLDKEFCFFLLWSLRKLQNMPENGCGHSNQLRNLTGEASRSTGGGKHTHTYGETIKEF